MNTLSYRTLSANKITVQKEWLVIDATDMILGRLSSKVANLLRGKHRSNYTPHVDCGDNIIVLNADKIKLTGKKWTDKKYFSHTGYPGGQKVVNPTELKAKSSTLLVEHAVKGMLPKNKLGSKLYKNLYVYEGAEHKHQAQEPKDFKI